MAELRYKAKRPALIDALAVAGISTADALAQKLDISPNTAQKVMRGEAVSLKVAIEVVHALQSSGAEIAVSTGFDEVAA